jgi:predicted PhzF superfamily epimerase YddE/YHI9
LTFRWFTPAIEINLCGHATLGSAWVIFNKLDYKKEQINFSCKSGKLSVDKRGDVIQMDFPSWKPERFNDYPDELLKAIKDQ